MLHATDEILPKCIFINSQNNEITDSVYKNSRICKSSGKQEKEIEEEERPQDEKPEEWLQIALLPLPCGGLCLTQSSPRVAHTCLQSYGQALFRSSTQQPRSNMVVSLLLKVSSDLHCLGLLLNRGGCPKTSADPFQSIQVQVPSWTHQKKGGTWNGVWASVL